MPDLPLLLCPVCGFNNVHLTAVDSSTRPDGEVDSVSLTGYCEDGHRFVIAYRQHKGETRVSYRQLP